MIQTENESTVPKVTYNRMYHIEELRQKNISHCVEGSPTAHETINVLKTNGIPKERNQLKHILFKHWTAGAERKRYLRRTFWNQYPLEDVAPNLR